MSNIFTAPESTSQQMADSIPRGRAYGSKNIEDSNTRKLINSLAVAHNRAQQQIELLEQQYRIEQTTDLLVEWETSVGLPSECSREPGTLAQRRQAIIERLRKKPIVTLAELQTFVNNALPDTTVVLYAGEDYQNYPGGFPAVNKKFIIVGEIQTGGETFEYEFEMPFIGGIDTSQIECVLNKIIPSDVLLLLYFI
jgi:uncharacterized protein YmfQ (DUF2313 family)